MGAPVKIKLNGMNNRVAEYALPDGKASRAVNCIFDDSGNIIFPNPGRVRKYAGDCKWIFEGDTITLFVEDGSLKKLNSDYTATTLKTGIGSDRVYYTPIADTVYWSNTLARGKIKNSINTEWGVARPPRQPDAVAVSSGGMFAGEYRIAITWLGTDGEEGGTGGGKRVTVSEGGGIHLNNFPAPPDYCTGVCIYVSSVNGKDMYLYGEYPANISELTLAKRICTIPLSTQFAFSPLPRESVIAHYGRIYYIYNDKLYRTEIHRYGLQKAGRFWRFDSDVQTVVSCPNVLYVGTLHKIYSIRNIDGEGAAVIEELKAYGSVKGSECYSPDGDALFMSDRGFIVAKPEGLIEASFADNALPFFDTGTMAVREYDGSRYAFFVGRGATVNNAANADYIAAEALRGSV